MLLFPSPSSSSSTTSTTTPTLNLNSPKYPSRTRLPPVKSLQSPAYNQNAITNTNTNTVSTTKDDVVSRRDNLEDFLVRRPAIKPKGREDSRNEEEEAEEEEKGEEKSVLDRSLENLAKKLPMFEPGKGEVGQSGAGVKEKPLKINLDLALYKAKVLTRTFQFSQAQELLQQVL